MYICLKLDDTIRQAIVIALKESGIKASELAKRVGITRGPMCLYLNGKVSLSDDTKEKIFEELNIKLVIFKQGETIQIIRDANSL